MEEILGNSCVVLSLLHNAHILCTIIPHSPLGAIDVDTGLSVAVAPPDLPPVELGDAEDAAAQLAAAAGVAAAENGVVAGLPGLPPLINNPAQGFNLPELIIPAKWLSRFVSTSVTLFVRLCAFLSCLILLLPSQSIHRRRSNASTPPTGTVTYPRSMMRISNLVLGFAPKNSNTNFSSRANPLTCLKPALIC